LHKKLFSILLTVAFVTGLVAIAVPAQAESSGDAVNNFMPDDSGNWPNNTTVLSDRPDGIDSLAHLTAITQSGITNARWYQCPQGIEASKPVGTNPGNDDTKVDTNELPSCDVFIGQDTTPKQPSAASGGVFSGSPDLAFDVSWNIPADKFDPAPAGPGGGDDRVDILTLGCVGDPAAAPVLTGGSKTCIQDRENAITVDDSASAGAGANQQSTGEMFAFCTADTAATAGPGEGTSTQAGEPCQYDVNENGTIAAPDAVTPTEQAAVDARFKPWTHGDPIPNEGATIRASTSTDLTNLFIYRDYTNIAASSPTEPSGVDAPGVVGCSLIKTTSTAKTWECNLADVVGNPEDGKPAAVVIDTTTATGGPLVGGAIIALDIHYTAAAARTTATVVSTFAPGNQQSPASTSPANTASCSAPDKEETNVLGDDEDEIVCFTDQFNDPFAPPNATLESAGVGGFVNCPGQLHDHDGNGLAEHCHLTAVDFFSGQAGNNAAPFSLPDIDINNTTAAGDQTLTVCAEGQPGPATVSGNPAPAGHGCANETPKDTQVKHWIVIPDHVHLVFQGTGAATDPCHTGDTTKENKVGDIDTLLVCTQLGANHIPATTNQTNGGRLQWTIVPSGGGEVTATRFATPPPSETGADGTATAQLEAFRPGNDIVTAFLCADTGGCGTFSAVQKRVTAPEVAQCADNADNDADGKVDFPQDPGCSNADDNDETDVPQPNTKSATGVSIRYAGGAFKGTVSNSVARCVVRRLVVVKRAQPGPDATVGSDRASRRGKWSLRAPTANGRYYAKAGRTRFSKSNGATHTCLAGKSRTIKVQQ
jgi:hypothetical protein